MRKSCRLRRQIAEIDAQEAEVPSGDRLRLGSCLSLGKRIDAGRRMIKGASHQARGHESAGKALAWNFQSAWDETSR